MGLCYYFYKNIDTNKHWTEWHEIDSAKYCGIPDSIREYGATKIVPKCNGCMYEDNSKSDNYFDHIHCFECEDGHTAYLITREQAIKIQKNMECNKTLFTDLMDSINQEYIYMRYDY